MGKALTSTLTMNLRDNVSKPARDVAQALQDAERNVRKIAKGMADTGASDRLVKSLSRLSLSKKDIEQVASAWKDYARSAGLAANSANWTKSQAASVKAWEAQTLASLRAVKREQQAFAKEMTQAKNKPTFAENAGGVIGGTAAGNMLKREYERARDGWIEMDESIRRQRAIMKTTTEQQAPMVKQAFRVGGETKFTNADIVKGQTAINARLPNELQKPAIVQAITEHVKNYALAMSTTMEEGAEAVVSRMLSLKYDMSSPEAAEASARRASNRLVEWAKTSGTTRHDDIINYNKMANAPGRVAGFSEEFSDAMAAQLRRVGFDGSMSGTFVRAAGTRLSVLNKNGKDALAADGHNYNDYVRPGTNFSADALSNFLKGRFTRGLSKDQIKRVSELFDDESVIGDRGEFNAKLGEVVAETLAKKNKKTGEVNASDMERIGKALDQFYQLNASGVDSERLMTDILKKGMSPAVARYLFGQEHGGRAQTLDYQQLQNDIETLKNTPDDRAKAIGDAINAGAYGSYTRMIGSIETLHTRLGQVNDGLLRMSWDTVNSAVDSLSNLPDRVLQVGTAAGIAAGAIGTMTAAANAFAFLGMGGPKALLGKAMPYLGWAGLIGAGGYLVGEAVNAMDESRLSPKEDGKTYTSDVLKSAADWGNGLLGKPSRRPPDSFDAEAHARKARGESPVWLPTMARKEGSTPHLDATSIDRAKTSATNAKDAVTGLNLSVKPTVDNSDIERTIKLYERAIGLAHQFGTVSSRVAASAQIPSLGQLQRGSFTTGGVSGE